MSDLKACSACKVSKRKCTKTLPSCRRCAHRGLACVYETRPRIIIYQGHTATTHSEPLQAQHEHTQGRYEVGDMQVANYAASAHHQLDLQPAPEAPMRLSLDDLRSAWFLTPYAWIMMPPNPKYHTHISPGVVRGAIHTAQSWLREWASTGGNPFIHSELYRQGTPGCVQDAFMALSTYLSRTHLNNDFVLGLIQQKSDQLVASEAVEYTGNIMDGISRVHALLVYTIIRVFDGDVSQRHLAEQHMELLMQWADAIRKQTERRTARDGVLLCHALNVSANDTSAEKQSNFASLEELLWRAWIISESVRRIWYMCRLSYNAYKLLKSGAIDCDGTLPTTARGGLWEAKTAMSWMMMCAEKCVDFCHTMEYQDLLTKRRVDEVDPFALALMEVDLGPEKMQRWREVAA